MNSFNDFFKKLAGIDDPHNWQIELAVDPTIQNRLIRIPTGFGKTLGVLAAWLWHRMEGHDEKWPRRLIWCLPMRVLVEQTENEVRKSLERLGLLWTEGDNHRGKVGVHLLMGGADAKGWHLYPEECAVLIGTQDMLLSRAMNRGYASPRARWPMEFGLLNQDSLWVMDEVQLMDVGFATSMQLQAFRDDETSAGHTIRPCFTWWMSATLQAEWLIKSPDTRNMAEIVVHTGIPSSVRTGHLWDDVNKPCRLESASDEKGLAQLILREYLDTGRMARGVCLVVVNTVDRAVKIHDLLRDNNRLKDEGVEIRLVHSRFRPAERVSWRSKFLNRAACEPGHKRIIIATQVIEAGVDISAALLITELAPWASLVQRFGRCARWGGDAGVIVIDFSPKDDKSAAPYMKDELDAAREALSCIVDAAPFHLEAFEESHPELLPRLYPFEPEHLLLRHEVGELFDTTPDLSGADIDVSRFIRSGEERDIRVFWIEIPEKTEPSPDIWPAREALCTVPFLKARDWLCGEEKTSKKPRLKEKMHAWVWDWLNGVWKKAERRDLYPGQTVLVAANCGGYNQTSGWDPTNRKPVVPVVGSDALPQDKADANPSSDALSVSQWQTIAVHGQETGKIAKKMAEALVPVFASLLDLTGRCHDTGKAHEAFQASIKEVAGKPQGELLAKAPKDVWLKGNNLYRMKNSEHRAGFRHELVSVLSLFALLQRLNPDHPALLGPWRELLAAAGFEPSAAISPHQSLNLLEQEILDLEAGTFNLLVYLICTHHGKVRLAWHASPVDQAANDAQPRIMGVKDGDNIPDISLVDSNGGIQKLNGFSVDLSVAAAGLNPKTGMGWTERVLKLLETHGPFTLAWMEAIFRAADQRASNLSVKDELLCQKEAL